MMLLFQFVCPSAKELKQMTMAEFGLQAAHNTMFVGVVDVDATSRLGVVDVDATSRLGVVDVDATSRLGVNKIGISVFNKPTLYHIPKGGFMLVKDEEEIEEIMLLPFANLMQEPQSYNNGQVLTLNVRPVKFKDTPNGVELIVYDRNPKDTKAKE